MNGGDKVFITNMLKVYHNVKVFNTRFKRNVQIYGAISKQAIKSTTVDYLCVCALMREEYIDV